MHTRVVFRCKSALQAISRLASGQIQVILGASGTSLGKYHVKYTQTLPPMHVFRDIVAGPAENRRTPGVLWPEFDSQTSVRLWRDNRIFCQKPTFDTSNPVRVPDPIVFVSMHDNHFGHICAETVPRIPQSLVDAPGLPLYFSAQRPVTMETAHPVFQSIMRWLNIPFDLIRFYNLPTVFSEMHVAAQAEALNGPPAPEEYIDLLEARIHKNLSPMMLQGIVYVTRAQLGPRTGMMAGERYLAFCLEQLGVRVIYPELMSLPDQMRAYASARDLVFSEGSAVHGRQLLGRIDQNIWVMRRRKHSHLALHQLTPRCTHMRYVSSLTGALGFTGPDGWKVDYQMCTIYNVPNIHDFFKELGVPLADFWNHTIYERQRDEDVLSWIRAHYHPSFGNWMKPHDSDEAMLAQLDALGLGHLKPEVKALMAAYRDGA